MLQYFIPFYGNNVLVYGYITGCSSIHSLMDILVASTFSLLPIALL